LRVLLPISFAALLFLPLEGPSAYKFVRLTFCGPLLFLMEELANRSLFFFCLVPLPPDPPFCGQVRTGAGLFSLTVAFPYRVLLETPAARFFFFFFCEQFLLFPPPLLLVVESLGIPESPLAFFFASQISFFP